MPIYEYECGACGAQAEVLVPRADAPAPACPDCGAPAMAKRFSTFAPAVGAGGQSAPALPACGTCGGMPGSCMLN